MPHRAINLGIGAATLAVAATVSFTPFPNPSGVGGTFTNNGPVDDQNPFFQVLGTNGRACVTCHQPRDGFTVSAVHIEERFVASRGADPIFRTNDGSDCPGQANYSLLRTRGLIRVELPIPAGAEFSLASAQDRFGCNSDPAHIGLYRRPLPAANLRFLTAVMWDGRETFSGNTLEQNLAHQAMDATLGHAAALGSPAGAQLSAIVGFEMSVYVAQQQDREAGELKARGARGGPAAVSSLPFYPGINDPVGLNPTGTAFNPEAFTLYQEWAASPEPDQRLIALGERIFNTKQFTIANVPGLNDRFLGGAALHTGTCTICHDTPNVGNHSVPAPLNIGTADPVRAPFLPVYTLSCNTGPLAGQMIATTDPGRAMLTGKCEDIGKVKGPILRSLASRAPYFHNGSARTVAEVVDFYDSRFAIGFTPLEKTALAAFLGAL